MNALMHHFCWTIMLSLLCHAQCLFVPYVPCDKDILKPCTIHPSLPKSIICEKIQDIRKFVHVLRCNRNKNVQEVFLVESTIDHLPLFILDFCGFSFLNLKTVSMNKLLDGNEMVRLEQLHLDDVTIDEPWNWEPLGVLQKLRRFSVSNMNIGVLNGSLLDHLNDHLQSFTLTSTNTISIVDYAFAKFRNLAYVSVQDNEIQYLRRSMFPKFSRIKYFYFGKNKISSLPEDIFQDMPHLQAVDLEQNLLSELNEITFRRVWNQLSYVLLEGNPLKCGCKMLWMSKRKISSVFQGECYSPKKNFGKELRNLKLSDFHCF